MVNSGSFDTDSDRNAKADFKQLNTSLESAQTVSPVQAVSVRVCENVFATRTADDSFPVSQAFEPTATKTQFKCNMSSVNGNRFQISKATNSSVNEENEPERETVPAHAGDVKLSSGAGQITNEKKLKTSVFCSVPLDKVQDILKVFQTKEPRAVSKKLMCFFCDRTFVSKYLKQKHVDRCHSLKYTRRLSARRTQHSTTACIYCPKFDDADFNLEQLFAHLISEHSSKYFGCVECKERFPNAQSLRSHNSSIHGFAEEKSEEKVLGEGVEEREGQNESKEASTGERLGTGCFNKLRSLLEDSRTRQKAKRVPPDDGKDPPVIRELNAFGRTKIQPKILRIKHKRKAKENVYFNDALDKARKRKGKTSVPVRNLRNRRLLNTSNKSGPKQNTRVTRQQAKLSVGGKKPKKRTKPAKPEEALVIKPPQIPSHSYPTFDFAFRVKKITDHSIDNLRISTMTFDDVFDKAFFNRVKCNIQENLLHFIDGKLFKNAESETRISSFERCPNFQPERQHPTPSQNYGCELSLSAATPMSTLFSASLFGEDLEAQIEYGAKASKKKSAPTVKQDEVHYKYFTRRKYQAVLSENREHRDLSKLDMWTQLTMKNRQHKVLSEQKSPKEKLEYAKSYEYKAKLQVEELDRILDKRGPVEDLKQEAMRTVALEKLNGTNGEDCKDSYFDVTVILNELINNVFVMEEDSESSVSPTMELACPLQSDEGRSTEIPSYLNLNRNVAKDLPCSSKSEETLVLKTKSKTVMELTGEWARTRIYICAACGVKLPNMKMLMDHKNIFHQNVWCQHYEFVGIQGELYRHLSIPGLGKIGEVEECPINQICRRSNARACSKCDKKFNCLGDLHRHMLECGEDWAWMLARRKVKYRPYGSKSRRKRRGLLQFLNSIRERKLEEPREKKKYKTRFDGPRPKPSDAETIQRMLANLPAKRATRKIISLKDGFQNIRKNSKITKSIQSNKSTKLKQNKVSEIKKRSTRFLRSNTKSSMASEFKILPDSITRRKIHLNCNPVLRRRSVRNIGKVLASKILKTNPPSKNKLVHLKAGKNLVVKTDDNEEVASESAQKPSLLEKIKSVRKSFTRKGAPKTVCESEESRNEDVEKNSADEKTTNKKRVLKKTAKKNIEKTSENHANKVDGTPDSKSGKFIINKLKTVILNNKTKTLKRNNRPDAILNGTAKTGDCGSALRIDVYGEELVQTKKQKNLDIGKNVEESQDSEAISTELPPVTKPKRKLKLKSVKPSAKKLKATQFPEPVPTLVQTAVSPQNQVGKRSKRKRKPIQNNTNFLCGSSNQKSEPSYLKSWGEFSEMPVLEKVASEHHSDPCFENAIPVLPLIGPILPSANEDTASAAAVGELGDEVQKEFAKNSDVIQNPDLPLQYPVDLSVKALNRGEDMHSDTLALQLDQNLPSENKQAGNNTKPKGKMKKIRGLNDCIAMLTSKLQQKLPLENGEQHGISELFDLSKRETLNIFVPPQVEESKPAEESQNFAPPSPPRKNIFDSTGGKTFKDLVFEDVSNQNNYVQDFVCNNRNTLLKGTTDIKRLGNVPPALLPTVPAGSLGEETSSLAVNVKGETNQSVTQSCNNSLVHNTPIPKAIEDDIESVFTPDHHEIKEVQNTSGVSELLLSEKDNCLSLPVETVSLKRRKSRKQKINENKAKTEDDIKSAVTLHHQEMKEVKNTSNISELLLSEKDNSSSHLAENVSVKRPRGRKPKSSGDNVKNGEAEDVLIQSCNMQNESITKDIQEDIQSVCEKDKAYAAFPVEKTSAKPRAKRNVKNIGNKITQKRIKTNKIVTGFEKIPQQIVAANTSLDNSNENGSPSEEMTLNVEIPDKYVPLLHIKNKKKASNWAKLKVGYRSRRKKKELSIVKAQIQDIHNADSAAKQDSPELENLVSSHVANLPEAEQFGDLPIEETFKGKIENVVENVTISQVGGEMAPLVVGAISDSDDDIPLSSFIKSGNNSSITEEFAENLETHTPEIKICEDVPAKMEEVVELKTTLSSKTKHKVMKGPKETRPAKPRIKKMQKENMTAQALANIDLIISEVIQNGELLSCQKVFAEDMSIHALKDSVNIQPLQEVTKDSAEKVEVEITTIVDLPAPVNLSKPKEKRKRRVRKQQGNESLKLRIIRKTKKKSDLVSVDVIVSPVVSDAINDDNLAVIKTGLDIKDTDNNERIEESLNVMKELPSTIEVKNKRKRRQVPKGMKGKTKINMEEYDKTISAVLDEFALSLNAEFGIVQGDSKSNLEKTTTGSASDLEVALGITEVNTDVSSLTEKLDEGRVGYVQEDVIKDSEEAVTSCNFKTITKTRRLRVVVPKQKRPQRKAKRKNLKLKISVAPLFQEESETLKSKSFESNPQPDVQVLLENRMFTKQIEEDSKDLQDDRGADLNSPLPSKENQKELLNKSIITTPDLGNASLAATIKSKFNLKMATSLKTTESVLCEICNKTFVRIENLIKHKRTLTHIAKLSELEAKEAAQKAKPVWDLEQDTENKFITLDDSSMSPQHELNINSLLESIEQSDKSDVELPKSPLMSSFTLSTARDSLKLADIINDVLSKPVDNELMQHNSFSDIILPSEREVKRCKSLGERKSFDSTSISLFGNLESTVGHNHAFEVSKIPTAADIILEKQISLLENIIEDNRTNLGNVDDIFASSKTSVSNYSTRSSSPEITSKQDQITFSHNTNIISDLIRPALHEENLMHVPQYEEISDDSTSVRHHFQEQKSRKVLNRDEELFLECCSLLKSGSDVSELSKKPKNGGQFLNNFDFKPLDEAEWLEQKSLPNGGRDFEENSSHDFISDYSRSNTPINNFCDDFSNSNTMMSIWDSNVQENDKGEPVRDLPIFEDISLDSKDSLRIVEEKYDEVAKPAETLQVSLEVPHLENSCYDERKINGECDLVIDCIAQDVHKDDIGHQELKKKVASRFGGLVMKAMRSRLQAVTQKSRNRKKSIPEDSGQPSITEYTVPLKKKKTDSVSSCSTNDTKKMLTKGAMKVFEGLKVSIPKEGLDMKEVFNCSPTSKQIEMEASKIYLAPEKIAEPEETDAIEVNKIVEKKETTVVKNGSKLRKTIFKRFGNKLGLKVTKKKPGIKTTKRSQSKHNTTRENNKQSHDIYDFEDTQDNVNIFAEVSLPLFRSFRNKYLSKTKDSHSKDSDEGLEAQLSDDGDPFNGEETSVSTGSTSSSKKLNDNKNITKKKCMIMGRIFKNALKSKIESEVRNIPSMDNSRLVENYVMHCPEVAKPNKDVTASNKLSDMEMNMLFDKLLHDGKGKETLLSLSRSAFSHKKPKTSAKIPKARKRHRAHSSGSTDEDFSITSNPRKRTTKKNDNTKDSGINLEQELKECIGVASRKTQRKCTSGKQNVLVEFWSSDESNSAEKNVLAEEPPFETKNNDFNTSFDVDIETGEAKLQAVVDDLVITNQLFSPILDDDAEHEVSPEGTILVDPKPRNSLNPKRARKISHSKVKHKKPKHDLGNGLSSKTIASTRQKRSGMDTLYYWSSSSEDELQDLIEVKPVREENDDEERPLQHGWIVGDSPKKLVTMLAQAKGKKVDAESVKEQTKKRTSV